MRIKRNGNYRLRHDITVRTARRANLDGSTCNVCGVSTLKVLNSTRPQVAQKDLHIVALGNRQMVQLFALCSHDLLLLAQRIRKHLREEGA